MVKATLGIDILEDVYNGEFFRLKLQEWIELNTNLIKTLPKNTLNTMRNIVTEGFLQGKTSKAVGKAIEDAYGVSKRKGQFFARDQIAKLNAALTQAQQEDAGCVEYVWRTCHDRRVRQDHADLDGTRQRWDAPPILGGRPCNPGEDYNCRCIALPVFDIEGLSMPWKTKKRRANAMKHQSPVVCEFCREIIEEATAIRDYTESIGVVAKNIDAAAIFAELRDDELAHMQKLVVALTQILHGEELDVGENMDESANIDLTTGAESGIIKSENHTDGGKGSGRYPKGSGEKNMQKLNATGANYTLPGFAKENLNKHFGNGGKSDHSGQYQGLTKAQYAERAERLVRSATSDVILGYRAKDGAIVRYDKNNNDLVRGYPGGIATMYKPKKDQTTGEAFFLKLMKVEGDTDD